jgi:hypothetical protein
VRIGTAVANVAASFSNIQLYPNPNDGNIYVSFYLPQSDEVVLRVSSSDGKLIEERKLGKKGIGENLIAYKLPDSAPTGSYIVTIATVGATSTQKIVLSR